MKGLPRQRLEYFNEMARPEGETSNSLFQILGEWNMYLQQIVASGQELSA
jgi:hypothetical protein